MANLTNIFISIHSFYRETSSLLKEMEMHFYLEKRIGTDWKIIKIDTVAQLLEHVDADYHSFFLSSETFDEGKFEDFYDDEFYMHAIEGLGGRSTKDELEMLSLRIISKTPDKKVKSFIGRLVKSLKKNGEYGQGVGPGESPLYSRMFYQKSDVYGRTLWFDFKRKVTSAYVR